MTLEQIAQIAHETNRAYCASMGDLTQPPWADAPEWQKQSAILGVQYHQQNPDAGPDGSHYSWMAQKVRDGWVYGPEKDEAKKTHPCMVPYDELPQFQKAKDYVFVGVVHALLPYLDKDGGSYAMLYLGDGEMPGTFRQELKFDDANVFNPKSHAHQNIKLCAEFLAGIYTKLDPVTHEPLEKQDAPVIELPPSIQSRMTH